MLISSENGGGEIVSSSDETRFYDDVGCLAADWIGRRGGRGALAYVRVPPGQWREAHAAFYAQPSGLRTAMASELAAFGTADEARAADRASRTLTFDDVIEHAGKVR